METLLTLPIETLTSIVQLSRYPDVVSISKCCRSLHVIAKEYQEKLTGMYLSIETDSYLPVEPAPMLSQVFETIVELGIGPLVEDLDVCSTMSIPSIHSTAVIKHRNTLRAILDESSTIGCLEAKPKTVSPLVKHLCSVAPSMSKNILDIIEGLLKFDIWSTLQLTLPLLSNLRSLRVSHEIFRYGINPLREYVMSTFDIGSSSTGSTRVAGNNISVAFALLEKLMLYAVGHGYNIEVLESCGPLMALPRIKSIQFDSVQAAHFFGLSGDPPASNTLKLLKFWDSGLTRRAAKSLVSDSTGPFHILIHGWADLDWVDVYETDDEDASLDPWWHMYRLEEGGPIEVSDGEINYEEMPEWTKAEPDEMNDAFKEYLKKQGTL